MLLDNGLALVHVIAMPGGEDVELDIVEGESLVLFEVGDIGIGQLARINDRDRASADDLEDAVFGDQRSVLVNTDPERVGVVCDRRDEASVTTALREMRIDDSAHEKFRARPAGRRTNRGRDITAPPALVPGRTTPFLYSSWSNIPISPPPIREVTCSWS